MTISALIFGGIGTLIETSTLQREAFNRAFTTLGIDFVWDHADYAASLSNSGGRNRLAAIALPGGARLTEAQIAAVHAEKTNAFDAMLADRVLPLRAGVADLLTRAAAAGIVVAWATTTSQANIDAILRASGGALTRTLFAFIGGDLAVERQKPDPEIYLRVLATLGIRPAAAIAIEDSATGVHSAKAAGLFTVAFPGEMHVGNLGGPDMITRSLDEVSLDR